MTSRKSRRDLIKLAGAGALATGSPASARTNARTSVKTGAKTGDRLMPTPADAMAVAPQSFPRDFLWGAATSAYQIEGAVKEDGRGESIWDRFAHTPGKISRGDTGDTALDHYHRFKGDIALIKALGVRSYRFSIAWPRIFPQGTGQPNDKGLDFYQRLTDTMLENGIAPFATLYHWDLPQALQDNGGWESRDTAKAFADYAGYIGEKLGDRIGHFFTVNEFAAFVDLGYGTGLFAPGLTLPPARLNQVRHNAVLGHGLAVQALRAHARPGTKIGLAENMVVTVPAIETAENIAAAERAARDLNASYLTLILEGRYSETFLASAGTDAPKSSDDDLRAIASPLDFIGVNVYTPRYVRAAATAPGYEVLPFARSHPRMASAWQYIGPEALYWAPRHLHKIWNVKEIFVSENGCGTTDDPAGDGTVHDTDRIMFLRNNLAMLQRACAEGVPVRGYFLWSAFDNFEWVDGYATRFGLIHVDFATQRRTPKLSASYYAEVIGRNAVV